MRPSFCIQAWKRVIDVIPIYVNLSPFLLPGETFLLSNVSTTVQVFASYDSNPSDLIDGVPLVDINNSKGFIQNIQHGLDGVIYTIIFNITTSTNRLIQQYLYLAILDTGLQPIAPIIPFYYTSWPYPIEYAEPFKSSIIPQFGHLLLNPSYSEYIKSSILPLYGDIILRLITYNNWLPEEIKSSILPLNLVLTSLTTITYNIPTEIMKSAILPQSISFTQVVVYYLNYAPEELKSSITPQGLSLT